MSNSFHHQNRLANDVAEVAQVRSAARKPTLFELMQLGDDLWVLRDGAKRERVDLPTELSELLTYVHGERGSFCTVISEGRKGICDLGQGVIATQTPRYQRDKRTGSRQPVIDPLTGETVIDLSFCSWTSALDALVEDEDLKLRLLYSAEGHWYRGQTHGDNRLNVYRWVPTVDVPRNISYDALAAESMSQNNARRGTGYQPDAEAGFNPRSDRSSRTAVAPVG